jgi:hypothetical protein
MNDDLNPLESERLRRLLAAAAELPREETPPEGAWLAIRSRIDAARVHAIAPGIKAPARRRNFQWWSVATAATMVLTVGLFFAMRGRGKAAPQSLAGSGASAAPLQRPVPVDSPAAQGPVRAVTTVPLAHAASNPALAAAIDQYHQAARELEAVVAARTAALPPATRDVVRRSLATIDSAITDLRTALGHDPANAALGQYLTAVYEQKLDFLKRVRALPGAGM